MFLRRFLFLCLAFTFFSACGNGAKKKDGQLVTDPGPIPRYLEDIPADTPYVFGSLEPAPPAVFQAIASKIKPSYDQARQMMQGFGQGDPAMVIADAFFEVFADNMFTQQGRESIGFSDSGVFVVYGVGVLPAVRWELGSGEKLNAAILQFESKSGVSRTAEKFGETPFWSYALDEIRFVMSISGNELSAGAATIDTVAMTTPFMIGAEKPSKSYGTTNQLEAIVAKYGFQKYAVGLVDLEGLAEMFLKPGDSSLRDKVFTALVKEPMKVDAICTEEFLAVAKHAPRMVFGANSMSETAISSTFGIELTNGLGADLARAKSPYPYGKTEVVNGAMASAGFGADFAELLNVVRGRLTMLRDNPFQCGELQNINTTASQALMGMQMVPPFVSDVKGFTVALTGIDVVQPPTNAQNQNPFPQPEYFFEGFATVASKDPKNLFSTLQTFVPEFSSISLPPNDTATAVTLPKDFSAFTGTNLFINKRTLTLTSGVDTPGSYGSMVTQTVSTDEPLPYARITYDMTKIFEVFSKSDPNLAMAGSMFGNMMGGRAVMEFTPNEQGLFVKVDQQLMSK